MITPHHPETQPVGIEQNTADRIAAEAIITKCGDQRPRFWEVLAKLAAAKFAGDPTPAIDDAAMAYDEARHFARSTKFPAGKHLGQAVIDVDADYVTWWADQGGNTRFTRELTRYVRSDYFLEAVQR